MQATQSAVPLTATYRLQLNARFTLKQAREIVAYLAELGISHLYCSPMLAARRGSVHGYDVVDPTRLNPELGDDADLRALADELRAHGMGLLLDVVPNHMAADAANPFWDDVLRHGEGSPWAHWFDIDWGAAGKRRQVVLPVLGDELDRVVDCGELAVRVDETGTRIAYFDKTFPVDPGTLPAELQLAQFDPAAIPEALHRFAGAAGRAHLRALLDAQHYRLVFWRRATAELNYRRFFDVDTLVALRMDDARVFEETHAQVLRWVRDGIVDGVRVDHVDGLRDPREYLDRLRAALDSAAGESQRRPLVFVEKILLPPEKLRAAWPVEGTTGYEFLNDVEDAFISPAGFATIEDCYRRIRRLGGSGFAEAARAGKRSVLESALRPDVTRVARLATPALDAGARDVCAAIVALIAALPVYRTYIQPPAAPHPDDVDVMERALANVNAAGAAGGLARALSNVLLGRAEAGDGARHREFVQRFQQTSGPATAKGVEDTALYQYIPLTSRNEVGGAPDRPLHDAVARLHAANGERAGRWPLSLLCTDTHDTKRSADVRARLDALSETPREWERAFRRWRRLNAKHRVTVRGRLVPDTNAEYLLYQSMLGIWPAPRAGRRADDLPDRAWREITCARLQQYMRKAVREAKLRTTWTDPDRVYENAIDDFIERVLEPADDAPFLPDLARFVARVSLIGAWNTLSRLAIHLTAPGTPDIYQGQELYTFSLVDPDNRRPVDYEQRRRVLAEAASADLSQIDVRDPRMKLFVMHRLLAMRKAKSQLFSGGTYVPLEARGARASHVIAFGRVRNGEFVITIAPRLVRELVEQRGSRREWWADTAIVLPSMLGDRELRSIFGGVFRSGPPGLSVGAVLETCPVALLTTL